MTLQRQIFLSFMMVQLFAWTHNLCAQQIQLLADDLPISIRGLSVVNNKVLWASGTKGTVGRSTNGGKTWKWQTVKGFETRDFRDIEAFDGRTAVIIAIAEPAVILRTTDGGKTWKVVYKNKTPGMFLDAVDFSDDLRGTVIGDPIDGHFFIAHTTDGGMTWKEMQADWLPKADSGEACFAASGTNLHLDSYGTTYFVSGGKKSRLFVNSIPQDLPLLQGRQSTGANSFVVHMSRGATSAIKIDTWIVVGGDFSTDTLRTGNCVLSRDRGKTWTAPTTSPAGYRSCVESIDPSSLLVCGTSGVDISTDEGMNWKNISATGFHVCARAKYGTATFLAGKGRIAKLVP